MRPMPSIRRFAGPLAPLALLTAACVAPQRPSARQDGPPGGRPRDFGAGGFGDRVLLEPIALPGVWLHHDLDDDPAATSRSYDGFGYGLRGALGNHDQSVGLCWQGITADDAGDTLRLDCLGLDVDVRTPLDDGTGLFFVRAGAGVGGAYCDLEGDDRLGVEGMAQLRLGIECVPHRRFQFGGHFGGLAIGHPGETEIYGTFLGVSGTLTF